MRALLFISFLIAWCCFFPLACAGRGIGPATPATATSPALAFKAEEVDVTVDWDSRGANVSDVGEGAAKISLTASDGSGLRLASVDARAVLYGPIAFTELHLVFSNPEPVTREGTFAITLPSGAGVSRFAMKLPQGWQEGEVVERQAARATYESFVRRKVDPALLEQDTGTNVFRGRVFPIFANEKKEIVISYTQTLVSSTEPYRMSLRGLPSLDQIDVQLLVPSRNKAFVLHRRSYTPDRDFVYKPPPGTADAVRGGRFAAVRVSAAAPPSSSGAGAPTGEPVGSLAVLIDSSASRAGDAYAADIAKVARIVAALQPTSLRVACFDQEVEPVASLEEAAKRKPAGASDFGGALRWLSASGASRALIVSDGAVTAGNLTATALAKDVGAGVRRIDALAVGAGRDAGTLKTLVAAREGGVLLSLDDTAPETAAMALRTGAGGGVIRRAEIVGATKTWPSSLAVTGAKATSAIAFVEIDEDKPLRSSVDGSIAKTAHVTAPQVVDTAPAALVERAVAEAHIRELEATRAATSEKARGEELAREIVMLSVRHRVLTDLTAMLVLETDWDYQRFNIPRDAMKDIPVVGSRGVEIVPRGGGHVLLPPSVTRNGGSPLVDRDVSGQQDVDGDGIPDVMDKCPNEPETFNGFEDEDGCPDRGRIVIQSDNILILQMIHFEFGGARILPESNEIVDMLATTLVHHPELELVGIMGHTDDRGSSAANKELSLARAVSVRDALIARGVNAKRLVAKGFGDTRPIEQNDTPEARAKNRRVEMKILVANGMPTGVEEGPAPWKTTSNSRSQAIPTLELRRGKPMPRGAAVSGRLADIFKLIEDKKADDALASADDWIRAAPTDMLAWIARGRALETLNRSREAARSYGSIIELASRPEHRRAAAGWLETLSTRHAPALDLAIEGYRRGLEERPDHPSSHRLYACSLARAGRTSIALDVTLEALAKGSFDKQRYPSAIEILKSDAGLFAVAAARGKSTVDTQAILKRARAAGATIPTSASTTFALTWETDESDLDLLITDPKNNKLTMASADARLGYGPELVSLDDKDRSLRLEVHQVRRGRVGDQRFAFGKVAIVEHDGRGALVFDDRPFVIMNENASTCLRGCTGRSP